AFLQPVSLGFHDVHWPQLPEFARPEARDHVLSDDLGVIHASLRGDTGFHVVADPALQEASHGLVCWLDEGFVTAFLDEPRELALGPTLGTRKHPDQSATPASHWMGWKIYRQLPAVLAGGARSPADSGGHGVPRAPPAISKRLEGRQLLVTLV